MFCSLKFYSRIFRPYLNNPSVEIRWTNQRLFSWEIKQKKQEILSRRWFVAWRTKFLHGTVDNESRKKIHSRIVKQLFLPRSILVWNQWTSKRNDNQRYSSRTSIYIWRIAHKNTSKTDLVTRQSKISFSNHWIRSKFYKRNALSDISE